MNTSSINFDAVSKNDELKNAAEVLKNWLRESPEIDYFTFDQICRDLTSELPAENFNRLLLRLVAEGDLIVKYRVKVAEGEYSEDEYDSLEEIPGCVFDSAFEPIDVEEEAKVPAYVPVK